MASSALNLYFIFIFFLIFIDYIINYFPSNLSLVDLSICRCGMHESYCRDSIYFGTYFLSIYSQCGITCSVVTIIYLFFYFHSLSFILF